MQTKTQLYPYQQHAIDKLARSRVGALFMEMGVGKTRTAIEFVRLRQTRIDRVVWFCPVTLKDTIEEEIRKHTDSRDINVFDGQTATHNLDRRALWHIVGIESMSSSNRVTLAANRLITTRTFVVVDESSYIKGHDSLRTMRITRLSERARYRMVLTGTPISQGVQDLYAQMRFLSPKILGYGSFYSFAANHLEYSDKYPGLVVRAHNTGWLAAKIQPYTYQITKEDAGLDLPEKLYDQHYFTLTAAQWEVYEQAKWDILMSAPDDEMDSYIIFQLFTALQQIASGFWNRDGRSLELNCERPGTLLNIVKQLPSDEKIIVWCKYRYSVRRVTEALGNEYGRAAVAQYYGDLSESARRAEKERWRREARFFVATAGCGGHGLTLNEAAYAIFYENEFKYANRLQAEDRNHRIGQTRRPTYIDVVGRCGIERRIMDSHARKGNAVDDFRRKVARLKKLKGKALKNEVARLL